MVTDPVSQLRVTMRGVGWIRMGSNDVNCVPGSTVTR